jgi:hypothetical protein
MQDMATAVDAPAAAAAELTLAATRVQARFRARHVRKLAKASFDEFREDKVKRSEQPPEIMDLYIIPDVALELDVEYPAESHKAGSFCIVGPPHTLAVLGKTTSKESGTDGSQRRRLSARERSDKGSAKKRHSAASALREGSALEGSKKDTTTSESSLREGSQKGVSSSSFSLLPSSSQLSSRALLSLEVLSPRHAERSAVERSARATAIRGVISPRSPVSLPAPVKLDAGIPVAATHFAYVYPLKHLVLPQALQPSGSPMRC